VQKSQLLSFSQLRNKIDPAQKAETQNDHARSTYDHCHPVIVKRGGDEGYGGELVGEESPGQRARSDRHNQLA